MSVGAAPDRAALERGQIGEHMSQETPSGPTGLGDATDRRAVVLALNPAGLPDPAAVGAATRAGALGVLELGADVPGVTTALVRRAAELATGPFGVRLPAGCPTDIRAMLAAGSGRIGLLLVDWAPGWTPRLFDVVGRVAPGVRILVAVTGADEAAAAVGAGADRLVARGHEAGGRVGDVSTFVLLQQLLDAHPGVAVWAWGGIGRHTAAGAVAGGAAGVVLDTQLALFADADLPAAVVTALGRSDGTDSRVVDGHRVLDVGEQLLPVGQDAGLAAVFAAAHPSREAALRAVRTAIEQAPAGERPGALGMPGALPVAQGPMTRVSDQPGFARAVAEHGGLPFLAVALSDGPTTTELLTATARELDGRPWGAGLLGFLDGDLQAAQLAAVRATRPAAVLVAGGRPSHAAALEADGIPTYLHVPSPVLLGQFLTAGARRFVFEGAECGGHVGPRCSFPLWQAQLEVLETHLDRHPDTAGIEVYFAGGVHDARSAAVVSAMAAPVAARGVSVGVLMGTAYLFTDEAVAHGAIRPGFREEALRATGTALVETAPGHRTRCLPTAFVEEFDRAAAEWEPLDKRERWTRLDGLATGRARIASKGLRRDGARIVEVDEDTQRAEGMYMAGQVVALRSTVTDIATLHAEVDAGAAGLLAARPDTAPATPARTTPRQEPVAIIGMACAFPGAPDLDAYWSLVLAGTDAVTEVPADRWDPAVYCDELGLSASRWGGFLPEIPFDPLAFGIPPASVTAIDPAQLVALKIARDALADAGYTDRPFDRESTGVIFGAEAGSDLAHAQVLRALLPGYLEAVPAELADQLPTPTEDSFPGQLSNVISGRIANRLDLGGVNYTVDAACGSSLAALAAACRELAEGAADLMLCGAVDLHNGVNDYLQFTQVGALSRTGRSRPFDTAADGIALGEGVACLVLKRLADAERDGDRIHAVVRGVGASSDGRSLGLTAPRPEGQHRALRRAYAAAGIEPTEIGLVEAHGTGTVVGDATELRTLNRFFTEHGAPAGTTALGSVKSQIGHTKCAAGLAGTIKAALALRHGVIPPTAHLKHPNTEWDPATSPFTFTTAARPWTRPRTARAAGVSAFGFGGTNFHAVLTAPPTGPDGPHAVRDQPAELFLLRGPDHARQLLDLALAEPAPTLRELAHTASLRTGTVHAALVSRDRAELVDQLRAVLGGTAAPGLHRTDTDTGPGRVAFLFSGQGSQQVGMFADLFVHVPELREVLDAAGPLADPIYPPRPADDAARAAQEERLRDTAAAQPALGTVEIAVHRWLTRLGVVPDMVGGHSYGELVALCVAGAFDPATLLCLSTERAAAILGAVGADPGAMAAVQAPADVVTGLLEDGVVVANHNAPTQVVVSGPTDAVERSVTALRAAGVGAKRLPVACAFHSPLVEGAEEVFAGVLAAAQLRPPRLPVWANRTAAPYPADPAQMRAELVGQLGSPVRFVEQVEAMYAAGARTFVEVGPGRVLAGLVGAILDGRPHRVIACGAAPGPAGLLTAAAQLAVAGVDLDLRWLFRGRRGQEPAAAGWTVDGRSVRRAGVSPPGALLSPTRLPGATMTHPNGAGTAYEQLLADYLAGSRELIAAQRDVLLSYLGGGQVTLPALPTAPAAAPAVLAPAPAPALAEPAGPVAEPAAATGPVDVLATVVEVIAERTGYPADMIEPDLDLEADLSVDSIKRTELAGLLVDRVGLTSQVSADEVDTVSRLRTAALIAEWLSQRLPDAAGARAGQAGEAPTGPVDTEPVPVGATPLRHRLVLRPAPLPGDAGERPTPGTVTVLGDPDSAATAALTRLLTAAGATVTTEPGPTDVLVDLTALDAEDPAAGQVAANLRAAIAADVRTALVVAPTGPGHEPTGPAAGLRGLVRTAAAEHPETLVRLVETSPDAELPERVMAELATADRSPVVVHAGQRLAPAVERADLAGPARRGAGPAGPGAAEAEAIGLDRNSVLLFIGGARGITARLAVAVAGAAGCRIVVAGRTPWPAEPEPDAVRTARDPLALRRALAGTGLSVAEVERRVPEVLAAREVTATLAALDAAGCTAEYHQLDVRQPEAVHQLVKDVHNRYARLDGVVFAAGVLDDRLLRDTDDASFSRVFDTKVDGVTALLDGICEIGVRPAFVALFGSVAAVRGNRGQAGYAAANDAIDSIGRVWAERTGVRLVTLHWGPWAPTGEHPGMVSPQLARDYARRGVGLLDPDAAVDAVLRELAYGDPAERAVLYAAPDASPESAPESTA